MSCEERRDPILLLAFGELEAGEAETLRTHLASGCAACTAHLAQARELALDLLLAPDPAQPPEAFESRLRARLEGSAPLRELAPKRAASGVALWVMVLSSTSS